MRLVPVPARAYTLAAEGHMATAVLFLGWNRPTAGRDGEAFKFLMSEGRDVLAKFQKQGFFERSEQIVLTPHGGTTNGMLLLHGERAKLDELRRTDEFEAFSMKLMMLLDGYAVVPGLNAEGLERAMARNKDLLK
jgi:hypothetical protein